ncbi:MAG: SDR family NAD(P)-dependent oxidoreductase [Phycisphaerales bacterium]
MGVICRVAVVTGAASGMGLAIARHLAARGHRIGLLDLHGDAALQAAEDLRKTGATAIGAQADVTDRGTVDAALDRVRADLGPIQIMVTSAGLDAFESFADITLESWERVLAVNLTGTFHSLQAALPDMLAARWGRMVTISSSSAQSGAPRMAHYVASKGGVIALTKALALDLAPHGITVNNIPPGMIDTPMLRRAEADGNVANLAKIAPRLIPIGRAGTPEEIAATCGFLCSEEAAFITGQVIGVNGGMVL